MKKGLFALRTKLIFSALTGAVFIFLISCGGNPIAAAKELLAKYESAKEKTEEPQEKTSELQVIPLPANVKVLEGQFTLRQETQVYHDGTPESQNAAEFFADWLKLPKPIKQISPQFPEGSITFTSLVANEKFPEGGYKIITLPRCVKVLSSNASGLFYAGQTLRQLFWDNKTIGASEIIDSPRYQWRGFLLDISRHFFDKEQIKRVIDRMALHKLNSLQFHLSDDQAWRIEIKRYPKLIEIGSIGENGNPKAPSRFFTQQEMKEIIEYARERHIRIVPEIEMPAHHGAAVRSYPEILACNPSHPTGMCCPGKDSTLRFLEGVLDEICETFDSPFIHIGGDECSKTEWKTCPDCQKRMKDNHLNSYDELQSWFIKHFDKYLADKGRRLIGWDDILDGGLAPDATVMSWRGSYHKMAANKGGLAAAKMGHDVVFTPVDYLYLDGPQFENVKDGHTYLGYRPMTNQKIYSYEPSDGFSPDEAKHILGVQANMWTEVCGAESDLEWKIFPRLSTLAEIAWIQPDKKDYTAFEKRLEIHRERLVKSGINAAPVKSPNLK
ncbi:MAG: beta-N-acetylhexosaminidase [Tannerella sp.]|nr:beta-N-acetylhexosaminidase [Tannerella sp.]